MRIFSIETSCDETALALLGADGGLSSPRFKIIKSLVSSQIEVHRPFGGVVPNLAKLEHTKNLPVLLEEMERASAGPEKADIIAVTSGPGLEPALWTGLTFAKELSKKHNKPLVGTNHLEGHLYSFLLAEKSGKTYKVSGINKLFPAIGLIVSGGHTALLVLENLKKRKKIGETVDDAIGEAFDKVARILSLPYPGGPEIERISSNIKNDLIPFPRPMLHQKNYNFSFSGLKTAVLYHVRDNPGIEDEDNKARVAASFQEAAVDVLVKKTFRAAEEYKAKTILLSGGVAANKALRSSLGKEAKKTKRKFLVAEFKHNTDNAVMIAVAAYINYVQKKKIPLVANGGLNIK